MSGGVNRLFVAALVAGAVMIAPTAAFACGGGAASAENVYTECIPSGGGAKPTTAAPSTAPTPAKPLPVSKQTARALAAAGSDKGTLSKLVTDPNLSSQSLAGSSSATTPSALGSAFDLGSGPTALLIALAGTAVLLLGGSGFRGWRRWRSRA
jgi:hypothetical protein